MMLRLGGGSVASRIARRELARHKGRSALIMALVGLPVAAVMVLAMIMVPDYRYDGMDEMFHGGDAVLMQLDGADGTCTQSSRADWACQEYRDGDSTGTKLLANFDKLAVPSDVQAAREATAPLVATIAGGDFSVSLLVTDLSELATAGAWVRSDATLPAPGEVLVSRGMQQRFEVQVGDSITLEGTSYRVSGTVRGNDYQPTILVGPDHPLADVAQASDQVNNRVFLSGRPLTDSEVTALNRDGVAHVTKQAYASRVSNGGQAEQMEAVLVGYGFVMTLMTATIAGAAFAIGVRQQRRALALLSASGAPGHVLRQAVLHQGVLLGAAGSLGGAALGLVAGAGLLTWMNARSVSMPAPLGVPWLALCGSVLVGTIAATFAAWVPARQVAAQDVLTAVRSAEAAQPRPRFPWLAVGLVVLGVLAAVVGPYIWPGQRINWQGKLSVERAIGPALMCVLFCFLGCLAAVPFLLDLLGRRAVGPLALRMALRDGARNRARAGAGVAASLAIATLIGSLLVAFESLNATEVARYTQALPTGTVQVGTTNPNDGHIFSTEQIDAARQVVTDTIGPIVREAQVREVVECQQGWCGSQATLEMPQPICREDGVCLGSNVTPVAYNPDLYRIVTGHVPGQQVTDVIAAGGAVVPPAYARDGYAELMTWTDGSDTPGRHKIPVLAQQEVGQYAFAALSALKAASPKGHEAVTQVVWQTEVDPTQQQVDDLQRNLQQAKLGDLAQYVSVEQGPHSSTPRIVMWTGLVGAALMLGVAAVAGALALRDARDAHASLAAIGASTGTLRGMAAIQALVSVGMGVAMGLLLGTLPVVVVVGATRGAIPLGIPWVWLIGLLVAVPMISALLAFVFSRPPTPRAARID